MDTTSIIGKDGTPVIVNSPNNGYGYGRDRDCVEELIVQNTINAGATSNLEATHRNTTAVIGAIGSAARDTIEASNRNGIAGIKETSDVGRDNIRETSRAGSDNIRETARGASENLRETARVGADLAGSISDLRSAIERTNGESRLSMALASGEIRELINTTAASNLMAIKDNGFAIREEGCKTREVVNDRFYTLNTEMLKGFAASQLEALRNKCDLEKQIAEICCCVEKDGNVTRSLVLAENTKRLESELQEARLKAAIAGLGTCSNGNGNGNGK